MLKAGCCARYSALSPFASGRKAGGGIAEHRSVADAEGFDPALLAQSERDEEPKFDQLGNGKVLVQFLPKRVVGDLGVPGNGAGIGQRHFFTLGELVRILEVE